MGIDFTKLPVFFLFRDMRNVFKKDELGLEIARMALPTALALTADPIASLIDTAFVGHLGPVELAAVGVSVAVCNQASKISIFPLVSITTSFVAEERNIGRSTTHVHDNENVQKGLTFSTETEVENLLTKDANCNPLSNDRDCTEFSKGENERRHVPSASTALVVGVVVGLLQALFLVFAAKPILRYMGVNAETRMLKPALQYLTIRSLGSPAFVLSLSMQGIFRGLKDTKTPLYATVVGSGLNIILDPIFMFILNMGVSGAAVAHVISQYLICLVLLWNLMEQIDLVPPNIKDMQLRRFLKDGFLLMLRVIAVTSCVTIAASLAARQGSTSMAAFQVCLQVWMATSLLADGLAVSGQAILAGAFARKEYDKAITTTARLLQAGLVLGLIFSVIVLLVLQFFSGLITKDINVLQLISMAIPFVAVTQPINWLAFVLDGINYGASDFAYSAYSMTIVATLSIMNLHILSRIRDFVGIWMALSLYMSLRMVASFLRIATWGGPWRFLRS